MWQQSVCERGCVLSGQVGPVSPAGLSGLSHQSFLEKPAATGSCVFLIAEGKEGYHEALERCGYANQKLLRSFRKEAGRVEHGSPDLMWINKLSANISVR